MTPKAQDISQQLLTVCADVNNDGNLDGVGLFDEFDFTADGGLSTDDDSYFWTVDNTGARNAELKFFRISDLKDLDDNTGEDCVWYSTTRNKACDV